MNYGFNSSVCRFKCCNVEMIGDSSTGIVIGLDSEGACFVDNLFSDSSTKPASEKEHKLFQELQDSGLFIENATHMPFTVNMAYFHVTSRCNLNCVGCYSDEENRNCKNDLTTEQCLRIIDNLKQSNVTNIIISGGEPFLRNDLVDILKYAKQDCSIPVIQVVSNGMVERKKYIEALPYIDSLSISVDGYNEKTSFLRNSNMEYVLGTVKYLSSITPKICMIFTLNAQNIPFISDYINLSNSLHVPFTFSLLTVRDTEELKPFCLGEKEYSFLGEIEKIQDFPIDDVTQGNCIGCKRSCGLGKYTISIASNGDVYPCHMLQTPSLRIGSALNNNLTVLLSTHKSNWNVDNITECVDCDYKYICGGGCYARRFFDNPSIQASHDPCCNLYKADISRIISELTENR